MLHAHTGSTYTLHTRCCRICITHTHVLRTQTQTLHAHAHVVPHIHAQALHAHTSSCTKITPSPHSEMYLRWGPAPRFPVPAWPRKGWGGSRWGWDLILHCSPQTLWGWRSTGTGCPVRLWSLLLWRYSRPTWTRSCAACCRWPGFGRRIGLDDPQRSLPTPNILWFCEKHLLRGSKKSPWQCLILFSQLPWQFRKPELKQDGRVLFLTAA